MKIVIYSCPSDDFVATFGNGRKPEPFRHIWRMHIEIREGATLKPAHASVMNAAPASTCRSCAACTPRTIKMSTSGWSQRNSMDYPAVLHAHARHAATPVASPPEYSPLVPHLSSRWGTRITLGSLPSASWHADTAHKRPSSWHATHDYLYRFFNGHLGYHFN